MSKKTSEDELEKDLMEDSVASKSESSVETPDTNDLADIISEQLETEEVKDYKYLKLMLEQLSEREYELHIKHQSHGFMNYLVSKVIKCSGVDFAAYKNTSLAPPVLYIRIDGTKDIKNVLREAIKIMKTEWKGMGNAVSAMKI